MDEKLLTGLKVLCVDDVQDSLNLLSIVLKINGAQVTACNSGEAALKATLSTKFDVIVSDLSMPPGMDGYDLVHALRARQREDGESPTPTMAVSGDANKPSIKRRFADFQVYMPKPFDHKKLVDIVGRLADADGGAVEVGTLARYDAEKILREP